MRFKYFAYHAIQYHQYFLLVFGVQKFKILKSEGFYSEFRDILFLSRFAQIATYLSKV